MQCVNHFAIFLLPCFFTWPNLQRESSQGKLVNKLINFLLKRRHLSAHSNALCCSSSNRLGYEKGCHAVDKNFALVDCTTYPLQSTNLEFIGYNLFVSV